MLDNWLVQGIIQNIVWALLVLVLGGTVAWVSTKSQKYANALLYGLSGSVLMLFLMVEGRAFFYPSAPVVVDKSITENQVKTVQVEHSVIDWNAPPSVEVVSKTFENERVTIDGRSFVKCKFKNVTMIYNGTAPYRIYLPEWAGHISWQTDNPAIDGAVTIVKLAMQIDPNFKFLVKQRD